MPRRCSSSTRSQAKSGSAITFAARRVGSRPSVMPPLRGSNGERGIAHRQLKMQVIDGRTCTVGVVGQKDARQSWRQLLGQPPGPQVALGGEILGMVRLPVRNQEGVELHEGKLVVEQVCRLPREGSPPEGLLAQKRLVELETLGVEGNADACGADAGRAPRTQRPDLVELHFPGSEGTRARRLDVIETDGHQLEEDAHVVLRLRELAARDEGAAAALGELAETPREAVAQPVMDGGVEAGVGEDQDEGAEPLFVLQQALEA